MPIETTTKIAIVSNALILCGESSLNALNDNRYGAEVGSNLFEEIYQSELQSNRWRFAMKKGALSQLVDVPLNEYRYVYQLPVDMLLPIGVFPSCDYEIYADHLYTDMSTVEMDYLFKPEVANLPSYFTVMLTYALARDMIKPITESDVAVRLMEGKYQMARNRAMFADAQGRPSKMVRHSPFTDNR